MTKIYLLFITYFVCVGRGRGTSTAKENPDCWKRIGSDTRSPHTCHRQIGREEQGSTECKFIVL